MKHCPTCQQSYPSEYTLCPRDGASLVETGQWSEGTIIRAKYRVLTKLGEGGMGAVYKVLHLRFSELRALKVLRPDVAHDSDFVKRFEREAVLTRRLQHPNVVRVDDIDEAENGCPFIVMEYIEGRSLANLIRAEAPLDHRRVSTIIKQLAAALEAAHQLGMVHRDIKPDNIVLVPTPSGEQAKVLDFGIAKLREEAAGEGAFRTATGTVLGTPQYMSPEQAMGKRGDELDGRSDLYSLGVVMYQMLTGLLPLRADSTTGWLIAQAKTPPTPITSARADLEIPEALARLVMQLLEKNPAARPATGAALIAEIEQAEKEIPLPETVRAGHTKEKLQAVAATHFPTLLRINQLSLWHWIAGGILALGLVGGWWGFKAYSAMAHARNGKTLYEKRDFDGAARDYSEAVRLKPNNPNFREGLGLALFSQCEKYRHELWKTERVPEPKAIRVVYLQLLNEAANESSEAVRLDRGNPEFHFNLGRTLWRNSDGEKREFREAIRLKPDYVEAHLALAQSLRTSDPTQAEKEYREAIRLKPNDPEFHLALAKSLSDDPTLAEKEYQEAIRLKPNDPDFHLAFAEFLRQRVPVPPVGFIDEQAEGEYRKAIQLSPNDPKYQVSLANLLCTGGDLDGAYVEFMKAMELMKPLDPAAFKYDYEARDVPIFLSTHGHMQQAIEANRAFVRLNPEDADAHRDLGDELCKARDFNGAVAEFREALRLGLNDESSHDSFAECLSNNGDLDEAITEYRLALRLRERSTAKGQDQYDQLGAKYGGTSLSIVLLGYDHWMLGRALESKGDLALASEEYAAALANSGTYDMPRMQADLDRVLKKRGINTREPIDLSAGYVAKQVAQQPAKNRHPSSKGQPPTKWDQPQK